MLPYAVICASTDGSWTPFVKTILQLVAKSNPALGQSLDFIYDECKDGWNNRLRACTILLGVIVAHCNELQTYSDLLCSIAWTLWQSGETVELSIPDMTGITELIPIQRYFDIGDEALCYASADAAIMDFAV